MRPRLLLPSEAARLNFDSARVYTFRRLNRWTQVEAAAWWGVSDRQWRRWEAGARVQKALLKRIVRRE